MDLVTESTYDDSVFERDTNSQDTTKHLPRVNDVPKIDDKNLEDIDSRVTKDIHDSKDFYDEDDTTLPVLDSTIDTTNRPNKSESKNQDSKNLTTDESDFNKIPIQNIILKSNEERNDIGKLGDKDNAVLKEKDKNLAEAKETNDNRINLAEVLANYEKPIENIPKSPRKVLNNQDQPNKPPSRLGRQESDLTSQKSMRSSEFESRQFVNSDRFYYNSGFPSLISSLGPNATNKTSKVKKKQQTLLPRQSEPLKETEDTSRLSKTHHKKEYAAFSLSMKRKNESTWTRIEAVAKEKMELYERYAIDMSLKLKRQREQINRRSQELLDSLAKIEEKKKEDKIYDSPHGRIWRHHRSMQRRVFNLEPMSARNKGFMSMSSGRTEMTEN